MGDNLDNKCLSCMTGAYDSLTGVCPVCHDHKDKENADHQLPRGTILGGRYLVGKALGQGGFGITYIGWDIPKNKKIAIKEYFPSGCAARKKDNYTVAPYRDSESENFYETGKLRFLDEAKRLKEINDVANVVRVSAYFVENNTAYIVMDYVEGMTFKKYLDDRGGRTSLSDVLEKLHPVVTALSEIHKKNILHRDISPDNIILSPLGAVLIDFGAAREYSFETPTSKTINVKTGYAPMEQYDTHGHQGPWTDIFAFASTIYRAVTGILPANAIKRSENSAELRLPHELNVDINPTEEQVLLKGMEIDIQRRYHDIDLFYQDLIAAHTSIALPSTVKPSRHEQIKKQQKQKRQKSGPGAVKEKNGVKRPVSKLVFAAALIISALYSVIYMIYLAGNNDLLAELTAQSILIPAALIAMAVVLLRSFSKRRNTCDGIVGLGLFVLLGISASSVFLACASEFGQFEYIDFDDLSEMLLHVHTPLIAALNVAAAILSKIRYGRLTFDLSTLSKTGKSDNRVLSLLMSVAFAVAGIYCAVCMLLLFVREELMIELTVQLILMTGVLIVSAVFFLGGYTEKGSDRNVFVRFALPALLAVSVLSLIVFYATGFGYYRTFDYELPYMLFYLHLPLMVILNALELVYSKETTGRLFPGSAARKALKGPNGGEGN